MAAPLQSHGNQNYPSRISHTAQEAEEAEKTSVVCTSTALIYINFGSEICLQYNITFKKMNEM